MSQSLILESLSAQQIFDDNMGDLKLSWVGGLEGADRKFPSEASEGNLRSAPSKPPTQESFKSPILSSKICWALKLSRINDCDMV